MNRIIIGIISVIIGSAIATIDIWISLIIKAIRRKIDLRKMRKEAND